MRAATGIARSGDMVCRVVMCAGGFGSDAYVHVCSVLLQDHMPLLGSITIGLWRVARGGISRTSPYRMVGNAFMDVITVTRFVRTSSQ